MPPCVTLMENSARCKGRTLNVNVVNKTEFSSSKEKTLRDRIFPRCNRSIFSWVAFRYARSYCKKSSYEEREALLDITRRLSVSRNPTPIINLRDDVRWSSVYSAQLGPFLEFLERHHRLFVISPSLGPVFCVTLCSWVWADAKSMMKQRDNCLAQLASRMAVTGRWDMTLHEAEVASNWQYKSFGNFRDCCVELLSDNADLYFDSRKMRIFARKENILANVRYKLAQIRSSSRFLASNIPQRLRVLLRWDCTTQELDEFLRSHSLVDDLKIVDTSKSSVSDTCPDRDSSSANPGLTDSNQMNPLIQVGTSQQDAPSNQTERFSPKRSSHPSLLSCSLSFPTILSIAASPPQGVGGSYSISETTEPSMIKNLELVNRTTSPLTPLTTRDTIADEGYINSGGSVTPPLSSRPHDSHPTPGLSPSSSLELALTPEHRSTLRDLSVSPLLSFPSQDSLYFLKHPLSSLCEEDLHSAEPLTRPALSIFSLTICQAFLHYWVSFSKWVEAPLSLVRSIVSSNVEVLLLILASVVVMCFSSIIAPYV